MSRFWAQRGDFFFSDHGSVLSLPNLMEVNAVGKVIFDPMAAASVLFRCQQSWMDLGLQPECASPGDKRFSWAYSSYVSITMLDERCLCL